jgi:hypothetical protein
MTFAVLFNNFLVSYQTIKNPVSLRRNRVVEIDGEARFAV